ncbi:hypothetical protein [Xenorhabdus innexi]|uniref:Uncharacterized protein n=1 Tax=Xenorhabdus innexi TaxID=290109 RepID=A0A1N6N047_9GAMM|nr:hypothetical protein [Xenorhabdus innexi]SIP74457.1 hypothetical protein XIS1_650016 [Xenorhabdus innexi]
MLNAEQQHENCRAQRCKNFNNQNGISLEPIMESTGLKREELLSLQSISLSSLWLPYLLFAAGKSIFPECV